MTKRVFNILVNARSEEAAVLAVQRMLTEKFPLRFDEPGKKARQVIEAIKERHPALSRAWGTGIGVVLQRIDSDMCQYVQKDMRENASPVLSVHDSFVCKRSDERRLLNTMGEALERVVAEFRRRGSDLLEDLIDKSVI